MKNSCFLLVAVLLATIANTTATVVRGETYPAERQSIAAIAPTLGLAQSRNHANLATALARTTPMLATEQQVSSASSDQGTTTVRWLDSDTSPRQRTNSAVVRNPSGPSANYWNQPLHQLPQAESAPFESQIIRTQANGEIFYSAQDLQGDLNPQTEAITPPTDSVSDEDYTNADSAADWGQPILTDDICCGKGCDIIGCKTCPTPRRRILVLGTEAVFLTPDINGQRSSYVFQSASPSASYTFGPGYSSSPNSDLDDFYMTPRLWMGVQGECWGVVGRYFHLRAEENAHDPFIPSTLDQGFDVNSLFEAYYTDLELTRNFCLNGSKNQFSFGVRYALIEHDESVYARTEVAEGITSGGARSNRQARGTGLTFGLNGKKPLFCNSCAHWFYNVRSSILWGCVHNEVETWSDTVATGGGTVVAGSVDGAIARINDDLFIGEVQLGLEWDFAMRCLPAKSFFRMAFEYQYWDASVGRAASGSFSGFSAPNTSQGTASADAPGIRTDLLGFHVGTGFTW